MPSPRATRCFWNALALFLVWLASTQQSWTVVRPLTSDAHTTPSDVQAAAFAPEAYCLRFQNGTEDCESYALLLLALAQANMQQKEDSAPRIPENLEPHHVVAANSSARMEAAVSGWCIIGGRGSWLLQGMTSMICLVALETCVYTTLMCLIVGACSVVFAILALRPRASTDAVASFFTYTQACVNALLLIEWWFYSSSFVDIAYLTMLQLRVFFGVSFWMVFIAVSFSVAASRISLRLSGLSPYHLARLHQLPVREPDEEIQCLEAADPLKCPANYKR
ncbi:hypothetical protein Poli38472_007507 [Pythium oligandrum]|uniref:Transmembrane protein n=1 Tax=Pythium oligandrum TaxID=41045 RepID=A0A8K1CSB8_PYTOL|nr:hypothetical protein Poli38472_007507 [Pythium oligandrum]|eukprot:TMW67835.1 hypothetical protein Poli38472_007507 [Pythium oligandrum]